MNCKFSNTARGALTLLLAGPALLAQATPEGLGVSLNLHGGLQTISRRDNLAVSDFGLGLELSHPWGEGSAAAELGFLYKAGSQALLDPTTIATVNQAALDPTASRDSRKNQVDGLIFRLSYTQPIGTVALRAGLEFMGAHFHQEYIADVSGTSTLGAFRDTYNGVLDKTTVVVNPFVGFSFPLDEVQTLHLTLTTFSYKTLDYVHVAGTVGDTNGWHTDQDFVRSTHRTLPKVEFTYGIRL